MQPSERDSAAATSGASDTAGKPVSVDHSGLAVHPVVARVLTVTPTDRYGNVIAGYQLGDGESRGDGAPIAARQAAEVLRWLAQAKRDGEQGCWCHRCLDDLADELAPKETNP